MTRRFFKPENIFLVIALVGGIAISVLTLFGGGFDENYQIARAWEMSGLKFIPNEQLSKGAYFPSLFLELSSRASKIVTIPDINFYKKNMGVHFDNLQMVPFQTRQIYNPVLALPGAIIFGVFGRVLNAPFLLVYFLARLAFLVVYSLLIYAAIKIIPYGKWILVLLALAPTTLQQASTISADAISNAGSFLFIAWVLAAAQDKTPFMKRTYIQFFLLVILLFSLKINCIVLILMIFLIPQERFGSRKQYWAILTAISFLFFLLVGGWNIIAYRQAGMVVNAPGVNPVQQVFGIVLQPITFLLVLFNNITTNWVTFYQQFVAIYGYEFGKVPDVIYIIYLFLVVVTLRYDLLPQTIRKKTRLAWLGIFGVGWLFSVLIIYLTDNQVGANIIFGFQGRYLTPFALLLMLPFLKGPVSIQTPVQQWLTKFFHPIFITGSVLCLVIFSAGLYFSFHVVCGTMLYSTGYCYQPQYKDWAPNLNYSQKITAGTSISQTFKGICDKMTLIRVWTDSPRLDTGWTTFTLKDTQNGDILLQKNVANQVISAKNWFSLNLDEPIVSKNRQFQLVISSDNASSENAIRVARSLHHDYSDGQMQINGQTQPIDLDFQYGCAVSRSKLFK